MKQLILNNEDYLVKSVTPLFKEVEEKNSVVIERFSISDSEAMFYNLRATRDMGAIFRVRSGDYTKLIINKELMMSDTPMERISNSEIVKRANGRVLIAGLGLGMIINSIMMKKEVAEIVVVENNRDVIDLVGDKFENNKVRIINENIFDFKTTEKFDVIYFDIWAKISTDNLVDIKKLHNKFKNNVNRKNKNWYMNSWMKEFLQRRKIVEKRESQGIWF